MVEILEKSIKNKVYEEAKIRASQGEMTFVLPISFFGNNKKMSKSEKVEYTNKMNLLLKKYFFSEVQWQHNGCGYSEGCDSNCFPTGFEIVIATLGSCGVLKS